jgi:cobalt-zinc-cadmium efflux system membrane fusion protein
VRAGAGSGAGSRGPGAGALVGGLAALVLTAASIGCGAKGGTPPNPKAEAPPPVVIEKEQDGSIVKVERPERFALVEAAARTVAPELNVTGTVSADVSRNVPVVSLASGRVVDIRARLGDQVTKGQLLMRVMSADISGAFSEYRKAKADLVLSEAQLDRAKLLFDHGAVARKDLEVAEDAAAKSKIDVENAIEHLHVLGADVDHPTSVIDINAPASGVIVEQNVTAAAGVKTLDNSPNLFTIADLSNVWVVCDVYENDLPGVHPGQTAEIRLNAYPGRVLSARISNIGPVLDPALRTAKVRLEVANPGILRLGMFVTATFHGQARETHAVVPAAAVLHLHDRDWVYVPLDGGRFHRVEVTAGNMLPGNMQEILAGVRAGQQVVANALIMDNAAEQ